MTTTTTAAQEWSAVAQAWDASTEYVDGHSAAATAALISALDVRPGDRLLELAAGPGSLGPTWSRLTGDTGRVVISDLAPGMVEAARKRNIHLDNVEVKLLDLSIGT